MCTPTDVELRRHGVQVAASLDNMDPIEKNYSTKQNLQTTTAKPVIREMAHLVKCLVHDPEGPSSDSSTQMESKGVKASNPSTGKVETRESLELPNRPS